MKTLLIILIVLFFFVPLVSTLAAEPSIHGNIEVGRDTEYPEAYVDINVSLNFDILVFKTSIYGGTLTWFTLPDEGLIMKNVLYDLYTFGIKVQYQQFYVDISHYCKHPEKMSSASESVSTVAIGVYF